MPVINLENKKVLIVEDDEMSFLYLRQLFLLTKGSITRVNTGSGAISAFRNEKDFEMILMDIQLPDIDGKEVTREIRKTDTLIPIIAQTASRSEDERDQILEAGCTDVLVKPFTMDQLFGVLEKYIRSESA